MFVSAWTNKYHNFGQTTTNRVESQHALLKRHLRGHNNSLEKLVRFVDRIIGSQVTNINESFETSRVKIWTHHRIPLFEELLGKVSHKALELILADHRKLTVLRTISGTCGCQTFTSCGLPCACRIQKFERRGGKIPLSVVDVFWTKLNSSPCFKDEEEIDVEKELKDVGNVLRKQPKPVTKILLKKIMSVVTPTKSDKKPPVVQRDTRGRPTKKMQEEREEEAARVSSGGQSTQMSRFDDARHSSYTASHELTPSPARHSSYVGSQGSRQSVESKGKKPVMQRSRSTANKAKAKLDFMGLSRDPLVFPLITDVKEFNDISRFDKYIPRRYHPYVEKLEDVVPDGNCGYRAVCRGLGMIQHKWDLIRQECLLELENNEQIWRHLFDREVEGRYNEVKTNINWFSVEGAPPSNWMWMPYAGLLIAQRFGMILHVLSIEGNRTYFPLLDSPHAEYIRRPHIAATIAHVRGNHFIYVKLADDHPMPMTDFFWNYYRGDAAANWAVVYDERLKRGIEGATQEHVDLTSETRNTLSLF
jgi:histone-lysine N-methyltransferase SETD2